MRVGHVTLLASVSLFVLALSGVVLAQQHAGHGAGQPGHAGHEAMSTPKAAAAEAPEVFCPTMKTGQLCSHGTADTLKLADAKREAWIAAARRYNKAVDTATVALLDEAKGILTPAEHQMVQRWFEKGLLNTQINALLAK